MSQKSIEVYVFHKSSEGLAACKARGYSIWDRLQEPCDPDRDSTGSEDKKIYIWMNGWMEG